VTGNTIASLDFLADFAAAAAAITVTDTESTHCDASLQSTSSYWSSRGRTQMSFDGVRVHPQVDPRSSLGALRLALLQHLIAAGVAGEKTPMILMRAAAASRDYQAQPMTLLASG